MTHTDIKAQVEAIKKVTENALRSKKSAMKFLVDAGIVNKEKLKTTTFTKSHK